MDIIYKMLSGNQAGKTSKDIEDFFFGLDSQLKSSTHFNFPDILMAEKTKQTLVETVLHF